MKIKSILLLTAFALMASAVVATAQDNKDNNNNPGRGGRGNFDPAQFRAAMEERLKTSLKVSDDEWKVLQPLIEARLVLEVSGNDVSYAPAQPLEKITCGDILQTLRAGGGSEVETRAEGGRHLVREEFDRIQQAEAEAASSVTLRDLVNRIRAKAG